MAAGLQREADGLEHRLAGAGVGKADAVELDTFDGFPRRAPRQRRGSLLELRKRRQIDQELAKPGNARGDLDEMRGDQILRLQQRHRGRGIEREVDDPGAQRLQQRQHCGDDRSDHEYGRRSVVEPHARIYSQAQQALLVERAAPQIVYVPRVAEQGPLGGRVASLQYAAGQVFGAPFKHRQPPLHPVHAPPAARAHEHGGYDDGDNDGDDPPSDAGQYRGDTDDAYGEPGYLRQVIERLLYRAAFGCGVGVPWRPRLHSPDQVHGLRMLDVAIRQARPLPSQVDAKTAPQPGFDSCVGDGPHAGLKKLDGEQRQQHRHRHGNRRRRKLALRRLQRRGDEALDCQHHERTARQAGGQGHRDADRRRARSVLEHDSKTAAQRITTPGKALPITGSATRVFVVTHGTHDRSSERAAVGGAVCT